MRVKTEAFETYLSASNVATPLEQLCCLAFHEDERIRAIVAEDPRLSCACLKELARDPSHEVRIAVAFNPRTPETILQLLADDDHPDVRYAMAENANLPSRFLRILAGDSHPYVAHRARKTLGRLEAEVEAVPLPHYRLAC